MTFLKFISTLSTVHTTLLRTFFKKSLFNLYFSHLKPFKSEFDLSLLWSKTFFPVSLIQDYSLTSKKVFFTQRKFSDLTKQSVFWIHLTFFSANPNFWLVSVSTASWCLNLVRRSIGEGLIYIRGLFVLFLFDAALTDDEPLWEPIEWSLTQSWIMFIFMFAWIGENLISSRYGSYTGRDKRVWFSWYKTFWLVEGWYILSLGATALFVVVPFYHELSYTLPLVVSWWNWYSRIFVLKFIGSYSLLLYVSYYLQLNIGTYHWRKLLVLVLFVNIGLSYMLYTHFFTSFFAYFTDPNWYHKTRLVDYVQLSHEPSKWSWGNSKRDHFSYHRSTTVFWLKNDVPFGGAFLIFHIMFFLCLFSLYLYWLTLFRRIYTTQEVTFTYTTYCVSGLRQFYYYFSGIYMLIFFSFVLQYWRLPIEYTWITNSNSIFTVIYRVIFEYW
jgi:hypothetical protein